MDLVNGVTQNSNNICDSMENKGDFGDGDSNNNNKPKLMAKSASETDGTSDDRVEMSGSVDEQQAPDREENPRSQQELFNNNNNNNNNNNKIATMSKATKAPVPDYLKAIGMDPRKFWPKKYRFTREKSPGQHNPLTIAQRNFYEHNGYLVIDQSVNPKLLDSLRDQYKQSSFVDEYLLDKLVAKSNRLLAYVKCFCDERLMLMTHQLIETFSSNETAKAIMDNKSQQANQRQQLFRDWIYLPFRPIDKVVCAITAIEELNHVLLVVPGTHRIGQCSISSTLETISAAYETSQESSQKSMARELFECAPENLSTLVEKSKKGFKYINLKPGQTLFYHPGLIHGFSDDLINFNKRQLASIAYYAAADCEYVDLRKSSIATAPGDQQSLPIQIPISLAHFKGQNPTDYSSWMGKPRLLTNELHL